MNKEILEYFRNAPEAKLQDLYTLSNMSESYINTSVRQLKAAGLLRYERYGNHTGRWIVTD